MLDITTYLSKSTFSVRIATNSTLETLKEEGGIKLYLHAKAQNNKANLAMLTFFKKNYNLNLRIKLGQKSRDKVLEIIS